MAQKVLSQETHNELTAGKSFGPVSENISYAGMIAVVLIFCLGLLGVAVPAEVAVAAATLFLVAVAWFTKGRKVVVETTVETIPDVEQGSGRHRAETDTE